MGARERLRDRADCKDGRTVAMTVSRLCAGIAMVAAVSTCNRGPDPMTLVQSPAEFACTEAVAEASGSRSVTLLALTRTGTGATAQFRADRAGTFWTCAATEAGLVTNLVQTGVAAAQ
jgi:hypothetical protein